MTTLRDMPMISVEQKNAFREAALKVEAERDELVAWKDDAMRELTALQQVTHQLAHNGAMCWDYSRDARAVMDREPVASLSRRDARMKAEALEELAAQPGMEHFTASRAAEVLGAAYRKQAATEAMDAIDGEDGDFANVRGIVERMIAAGYRKQAEGES